MKALLPALLLLVLAACERPASDSGGGGSSIGGFTMSEVVSGTVTWRLKARSTLVDEKKGVVNFSEPAIKFFDGKVQTSEISAKKGQLRMETRDTTLSDSVKVVSPRDGMTLFTDRLYYSSARNKIWTEDPVRILKGKAETRGRGFTANPDLSEIEILRQETRMAP